MGHFQECTLRMKYIKAYATKSKLSYWTLEGIYMTIKGPPGQLRTVAPDLHQIRGFPMVPNLS